MTVVKYLAQYTDMYTHLKWRRQPQSSFISIRDAMSSHKNSTRAITVEHWALSVTIGNTPHTPQRH